jgi:AcrR family transcriptional regulator
MDRRTRKTKKILSEVLIHLLAQKNLNQITVSEIIEQADVSRGTFYLHYKDVYDLYEKIEDELYEGLEKLCDTFSPKDQSNLIFLTEAITKYIAENKQSFSLLFRQEANWNTSRKLRSFFSNKLLVLEQDEYNLEYNAMESLFVVAGVSGVIEEWLTHSLEQPQETLSSLLQQILIKFY